jgi:xanthine phosphoribosyltransferase
MKLLIETIQKQGKILNGNILKVDDFINHQIDPKLMDEIGNEFFKHFKDKGITKVLTVEASGIAPAFMCALKLNVPLVFLKKTLPSTMTQPVTAEVFSYTKNKSYTLCMEKRFINENDQILFIDDFLANGEAFKGVESIIKQTNAQILGVGILIDKTFQQGHRYILEQGYDLYSLAKIKSFENGEIEFEEN